MKVEALILVKTVPGKTRVVVSQLAAAAKRKEGERPKYNIEGMKHVYRASGEYDIIAHVSATDTTGIFELSDRIVAIKGSDQSAVVKTKTIYLAPKTMGDP